MEKAYAQALWNMIEKGMDHSDAVRALHSLLQSQGRHELMPRIARAFERLATQKRTRDTIVLTVAQPAHEHTAHKEATKALADIGITTPAIETCVDESIIGGWRLEGREHLIDASYKKHLLAIYHAATS